MSSDFVKKITTPNPVFNNSNGSSGNSAANKSSLVNAPGFLFNPSIVRHNLGLYDDDETTQKVFDDVKILQNTNIESTSSFRYDSVETGLKSTQQLDLDMSKFVNHTFFDSAVSKVNIAFHRIVNDYPFDGTNKQVEAYEDSLTGFEKYVLSRFEKNIGYLIFSGTTGPAVEGKDGQFIEVKPGRGTLYPDFSSVSDGKNVLNPMDLSTTLEMYVNVCDQSHDNQSIAQIRKSATNSMSLFLSQSGASSSTSDVIFGITSGSISSYVSASIDKGKFNHVSAVYEASGSKEGNLSLFINGVLKSSGSNITKFDKLDFGDSSFIIGSGSSVNLTHFTDDGKSKSTFVTKQTFSGSIDELRYYNIKRNQDEIKKFGKRNVYSDPYLKLYFKFNEPAGSYNIPSVVLDSSGNAHHSKIINFSNSMRLTGSVKPPLIYEKRENNPVLFPEYGDNKILNQDLLLSASDYDDANPNLITKLIPAHYFLDGKIFEGISGVTGSIGDEYSASNIPGSGKIGSGQLLMSFLLLWAKHFDELKMFIDVFSRLVNIDYDKNVSAPDKFLYHLGRYYGLDLQSIFSNVGFEQFFENIAINNQESLSTFSLQKIQNEMWRRILVNLKSLQRSKGTINSIKGLIRTIGVNPDTIFEFREYGKPQRKYLSDSRKNISKNLNFLDFSGSLAKRTIAQQTSVDGQGFSKTTPYMLSPFLSGSQIEIGWPFSSIATRQSHFDQDGVIDKFGPHGLNRKPNDGLFTSGSFTYECVYRFPTKLSGSLAHYITQSLARIQTTGSVAAGGNVLVANLIATQQVGNEPTKLKLYFSDNRSNNAVHELIIPSASLFNGSPWYISFGKIRNDDPYMHDLRTESPYLSSSLFLRCGEIGTTKKSEYFSTSSFIHTSSYVQWGILDTMTAGHNASGSFLCIGSQSLNTAAPSSFSLNRSSIKKEVRHTDFSGQINFLRFWSRGTSEKEANERVSNIFSLATENTNYQYNHNHVISGAWNKLRIDAKIGIQATTASNSSGEFRIFDYSQNNFDITGSYVVPFAPWYANSGSHPNEDQLFHLRGYGFEPNKLLMKNHSVNYSMLSSKFDENDSVDKVRVRSFQDLEKLNEYSYSELAPIFQISENNQARDDNRFSIDLNATKALDEDIMKLFDSLDAFDGALGDPRIMFEDSYVELENLRKVYFNDLITRLDLSSYSQFFTWFDDAFTNLIVQFIPIRTRFLGVNYVIQSHALERHKFKYNFDHMYLMNRREPAFSFESD